MRKSSEIFFTVIFFPATDKFSDYIYIYKFTFKTKLNKCPKMQKKMQQKLYICTYIYMFSLIFLLILFSKVFILTFIFFEVKKQQQQKR